MEHVALNMRKYISYLDAEPISSNRWGYTSHDAHIELIALTYEGIPRDFKVFSLQMIWWRNTSWLTVTQPIAHATDHWSPKMHGQCTLWAMGIAPFRSWALHPSVWALHPLDLGHCTLECGHCTHEYGHCTPECGHCTPYENGHCALGRDIHIRVLKTEHQTTIWSIQH